MFGTNVTEGDPAYQDYLNYLNDLQQQGDPDPSMGGIGAGSQNSGGPSVLDHAISGGVAGLSASSPLASQIGTAISTTRATGSLLIGVNAGFNILYNIGVHSTEAGKGLGLSAGNLGTTLSTGQRVVSGITAAGEITIMVGGVRIITKLGSSVLAAEGASSQILRTPTQQLQSKFKHAADFGVQGNYNGANAVKFRSAINQHINSADVKVIQGTYRGQPVTHYVDPQTGLNVMSNSAGEFLSGWKLSPQQLQHVLTTGKLGGG